MKSRKFILTILCTGIVGFGIVWREIHSIPTAELLTAMSVILATYCGANVWQDKLLGGKK